MDMRHIGARALVLAVLSTVLVGVGASTAQPCAVRPRVGPGQVGTATLGLQLLLQRYGYPLPGTGFYGPRTRAAVQDFQRRNDIKPNGVVGSKTWRAGRAVARGVRAAAAAPRLDRRGDGPAAARPAVAGRAVPAAAGHRPVRRRAARAGDRLSTPGRHRGRRDRRDADLACADRRRPGRRHRGLLTGRLSSPSVDVIFTALLVIAGVAGTGLAGLVAFRLYLAER